MRARTHTVLAAAAVLALAAGPSAAPALAAPPATASAADGRAPDGAALRSALDGSRTSTPPPPSCGSATPTVTGTAARACAT